MELMGESELSFIPDKAINSLENTTTANPHLTTCTSLVWMTDSDIRLAAAYYNPTCPCKVLLWDRISTG